MVSDMNLEFKALFSRIQSPETAKRFKLLRFVTPEDLARTFQAEKTEISKHEDLSGFQSDSKPKTL